MFRLWLLPKQCHRVLRSSLSCPSAPAHWASSSDGVTARRLLRGRELGRGFEFLMASWYAFVIKLWAFEVGICDTSACREHSRSQACVRVVIVVNVDWDFFLVHYIVINLLSIFYPISQFTWHAALSNNDIDYLSMKFL